LSCYLTFFLFCLCVTLSSTFCLVHLISVLLLYYFHFVFMLFWISTFFCISVVLRFYFLFVFLLFYLSTFLSASVCPLDKSSSSSMIADGSSSARGIESSSSRSFSSTKWFSFVSIFICFDDGIYSGD
jgi:hypothetical protein